tara:strand:+ start:267 stop:749 length:483 start_codon:yes stop_codon:yes gene_type:complete
MKKFILLIVFCTFYNSLNAKSVSCEFEEVYQNGETHHGFFLLQNNQLRYEYYNNSLYTLLYLNEKMFIANNSEKNKIQLIQDNDILIPELIEIYSKFPKIKSKYKLKNYDIIIEKNKKFIKRLVIKSNDLNLSIYLINCNFNSIEKKYLNFNPILPYVFN